MTTGTLQSLDSGRPSTRDLTWTEKGDGLATVRGVDDKGFEDKLYSVVAFKGFGDGATPTKIDLRPEDRQELSRRHDDQLRIAQPSRGAKIFRP